MHEIVFLVKCLIALDATSICMAILSVWFRSNPGFTLFRYGEDVEVDYRGNEVSVANFIKVLTGRHEKGTPASRRLDTDEHSNVFVCTVCVTETIDAFLPYCVDIYDWSWWR